MVDYPLEPTVVTINSPLDIGFDSLETKFERLHKDHLKLMRDLETAKQAIQSHRNVIKQLREETYDGRFIWRLKPIDALFVEPAGYSSIPDDKYPGVRLYSQPFYTSRYGYKMNLGCLIDARNNKMTTYLTVNNDAYDIYNPWPLQFIARLIILAPNGLQIPSISAVINVRQETMSSFTKPPAYQFALGIALDHLRKYCMYNTIMVRVEVDLMMPISKSLPKPDAEVPIDVDS